MKVMAMAGAAVLLSAGCTGGEAPSADGVTPLPSLSVAVPLAASPVDFTGDLIARTVGTGNRQLMPVRLTADAELYLQCPRGGGVTVTYGAAGKSSCPSGGAPLIAQVTAPAYPVLLQFAVHAEPSAQWVLALDSHPIEISK